VVEDDRSLSKTAKKLGIKVSTAKAIVKRYKEHGTFFEIKKDREARMQEQERQKCS
jgi:transposase